MATRRLIIVLLLVTGYSVASQSIPLPTVQSFSGSPLLLEVTLADPHRVVTDLRFETASTSHEFRIPRAVDRDPLVMYVSPFFGPGVHTLAVTAAGADGAERTNELEIGFVDFVWGRDNMSFGNNAAYESVIGTFGEVLADWVDARFGAVDPADMVLLVDYMYGMFGSNTGRCYAFAGTEVRYWRWPELLPSWYDAAHDVRGTRAANQRAMNNLQFDIVFDHFVAGPGAAQIAEPMTRDAMAGEVSGIVARVAAGEPVAVGFAGPALHHAMLVFGYVRDPARETVDLLVANNWKSDEKLNIHSRDAEIVRVSLNAARDAAPIEWRYEEGLRRRAIDRLFRVEVRRGAYDHDPARFAGLLQELRNEFHAAREVRVVVEDAAGARLSDGDNESGQIGRRRVDGLPDVWYERVSRAYRLRYPAHRSLTLNVTDDTGSRVLAVFPGPTPDAASAMIQVTGAPEEGERVVRTVALRADGGRAGQAAEAAAR